MKRTIGVLLALGMVLALVVAACGDSTGTDIEATATAVAKARNQQGETAGPEQEAVATSLGQWVEGSGLAMVAYTIEDPAVPDPQNYQTRKGARLVAVEFEVGCLADSHIFQAQEAQLIDDLGRKHEAIYGAMADHRAIGSGAISMGERVRGWLAYELPDGVMPQALEYSPTVWGRDIKLEVSLVE
jgi:hypothetical protein